jgi:hypothetical protein
MHSICCVEADLGEGEPCRIYYLSTLKCMGCCMIPRTKSGGLIRTSRLLEDLVASKNSLAYNVNIKVKGL